LQERGLVQAMRGVMVQKLLEEGAEVMLGMTRDPLFGPLLAFGLGGVHVELLKDVSFRIHPLTDRDAHAMIREVKGFPLLDGYRGSPRTDLEALEDGLLRLSRLAADLPEITEIDLNPVKVLPRGRGVRVVDARMRLSASGS
jgi:acyl-CoA synthetase (NDP forming)